MSELAADRSAKLWLLGPARNGAGLQDTWAIRLATVLVALALIYLRMPENFIRPQFWGEDAAIFFKYVHEIGARGLLIPTAGYFITMPWLVALGAKLFSPEWAPWIYNYTGVGIALLGVYLATSPRFD